MFDFSATDKHSFSELNTPISPYNNQLFNDPSDPFALPTNYHLALSSYPQLSELEISTTTDNSLITSVEIASYLVREQLTDVAISPEYDEITGFAFGGNYDRQVAESLWQSLAQGDLSELPDIQVISSDILGNANGAYAKEIDTIFLSDQFVRSHNTQEIAGVLTEEIGHYIDSRINTVDAAGDEGDIFSRLVQGQSLSGADFTLLKQEDDSAVILLNGQEVFIEKNDTLSTAYNIGTLNSYRSFSDWVGSTDTNDYYRFSVGSQSNFSLSLTGLTADADVQLLNSAGTAITSSALSGTSNESITTQLSTGTYYVRVYPYSGTNTNYNLSLNATPLDYAGNSLSAARDLGTLNSSRSFSDWVGSADTNDYYRFSVGSQSNFSLSLTGLTADADVQLLNSAGTAITSSALSGTSNESITTQLSTGTYYVRVYPYSGTNTNYNLSLNATPLDYAGNSLSVARDLGTLNSSRSFSDWVGSADTNDYYRFSVGSQSNFSLSLTGLTADADVQLLNSSGSVITSSTASGNSSESINTQLNTGTYYVRVFPYSGANTNYNLSLNATAVSDWYGQNLRDAGLVSLTRSLANDGKLSRNDMISIFRNAEDGSVIDANELTDLRTIVSNSSRFAMDDFVKVLSNKIANSDPANSRSGFGNLYAGSSTTQMESLIGKWFLGNSRPSTSYTYQYASGSLFQNGISVNDIRQGNVGDCYYLATLCSLANDKPSYIQNMFIDNGDNTFTVRFYNNGVADYVTVDRYLPTNGSAAAYAGWGGGSYTSSSNELWVALAEKAYAQLAESGWSRPSTPSNSYSAIDGGNEYQVMNQITALSSSMTTNVTQQDMINRVNSNNLVTFGINARIFGSQYTGGHALAVTSYNSSTGRFHLHNPWGSNHLDLTWNELMSWATTGWSYTTV